MSLWYIWVVSRLWLKLPASDDRSWLCRDVTSLCDYAWDVVPAIQAAQFDMAAVIQREEQPQDTSLDWMRRLGLQPTPKLFVHPFDRIGRPDAFPLRAGKPEEGQQLIARFFQTTRDTFCPRPPGSQKARVCRPGHSLAVRFGDRMKRGPQFLQASFRRMRFEIPQLVDDTALDRRGRPRLPDGVTESRVAVNDHQHRRGDHLQHVFGRYQL